MKMIMTSFHVKNINLVQSEAIVTQEIWDNIEYSNTVTKVEYRPDFELTKHIHKHLLLSKLWDIYCEYLVNINLGQYWLK